jgi:uncharacterized protein (TIGR03066 family)
MRTFVGCVLTLVLAVSATAVAQEKGKIDGKLLIGKWAPKEEKKGPAMTLEFLKDGKLSLAVDFMGKMEKIDGTYKLDGDKLEVALKFGGDEKKETLTVKKLTDSELETVDSKDKKDTFTKVKEDAKKPAEKKPEEKKKP